MDFRERAKKLVAQMTLAEKMSMMRYDATAIPRLGIPAYTWWNEALHGVARSGTATVFPQAIGMAASFDTELLYEVACVIAEEARAKYNAYRTFGDTGTYEGLTMWSPNINIFRDPRWGRGHETYGEDPYLTAHMGDAFVRGLQGDGEYRKTDATLKHYAVHSGPEKLRHVFDVHVSYADLFGTYLPAFAYIIASAHPAAVMGAYNRLDGEPCCANHRLLGEILRNTYGFDGYVVSDCGAICDFHESHHVTKEPYQSAALAVNSGCQLNCGKVYRNLKIAYERGLVTEEPITAAAEVLMESRLRLGLFDKTPYDDIPYSVIGSDAHRALNRRMAEESVVLLKNNGALPLKNFKTLAVIGPTADDVTTLLANYNGTPDRYATILRGITEGFDGRVVYARGSEITFGGAPGTDPDLPEYLPHTLREAIIAVREADAVVLCLGLNPKMEGEGGEPGAEGDKVTIELPDVQKRLLAAVTSAACGKPIVCVHVSGSCMALGEVDRTCDAVLQCFYPGAEGGYAVADILFGRVSPSGRLPVTFYRGDDDLPLFEDYAMENRTYRFFKGTPLYPFGHGLSYGDVHESWESDDTVTVENRGGMGTGYAVLWYKDGALCGIRRLYLRVGDRVTIHFEPETLWEKVKNG